MNLLKNMVVRWFQFSYEIDIIVKGEQLLIANLFLMQKVIRHDIKPIKLIVDSQRQATIIRLLCMARLLPRCNLEVVRGNRYLGLEVLSSSEAESIIIVTSNAYVKHYQQLAGLRQKRKIIVL